MQDAFDRVAQEADAHRQRQEELAAQVDDLAAALDAERARRERTEADAGAAATVRGDADGAVVGKGAGPLRARRRSR